MSEEASSSKSPPASAHGASGDSVARASSEPPVDEPIASIGQDEDDEGASEGADVQGERPGHLKGKRKASETEEDSEEDSEIASGEAVGAGEDAAEEAGTPEGSGAQAAVSGDAGGSAHPWQAVWSAEKNAWYFWNTRSGEVTWTNPLEPSAATSSSSAAADTTAPPLPSGPPPLPAGPAPAMTGQLGPYRPPGGAPDIDPALAFLLPPEARGTGAAPAGPSFVGGTGGQTAQFNARTGRFTAADYQYSVDHLDEYNRMKRMNGQYFDHEAWERERAAEAIRRNAEESQGVSSKPQITKKDMERFKKQKLAKKMRNQAWLRD